MKLFSAAKVVIWLASMFFAAVAVSAGDRWVFVGDFDGVGGVYVTPSAKPSQAWMKLATSEGKTKSITLMEFDCASRQYRPYERTRYNDDGVAADVIEMIPNWREAVPDSAIEAVLSAGCKSRTSSASYESLQQTQDVSELGTDLSPFSVEKLGSSAYQKCSAAALSNVAEGDCLVQEFGRQEMLLYAAFEKSAYISSDNPELAKEARAVQDLWEKFRDRNCNLRAATPGSGAGLFRYSCLIRETITRRLELEKVWDH